METVNAKTVPMIENPHRVQVSKLYDTEHAQVMHTYEKGCVKLRAKVFLAFCKKQACRQISRNTYTSSHGTW